MGKSKVWQVGEGVPLKLKESNVGLEKNLEDWIDSSGGIRTFKLAQNGF